MDTIEDTNKRNDPREATMVAYATILFPSLFFKNPPSPPHRPAV